MVSVGRLPGTAGLSGNEVEEEYENKSVRADNYFVFVLVLCVFSNMAALHLARQKVKFMNSSRMWFLTRRRGERQVGIQYSSLYSSWHFRQL